MSTTQHQVLLVGEPTARLELDLMPYGLLSHHVDSASDAVAELKTRSWQLVVVSSLLPDMAGPAFIDGLLRHFDPATVVLMGDVDAQTAQTLSSSPRVRVFGGNVDGVLIADHLFKRANGVTAPPAAPGPGSLAHLFDSPVRTAPPPPPQATPQGAFSMPPPTNSLGGWPATTQPLATPAARPNTTMPFFAAFGGQASGGQAAPSTPPINSGFDHARLENAGHELAQSNAELVALRARLAAAEQHAHEATQRLVDGDHHRQQLEDQVHTLRAEVAMAREAAAVDVAEIETLGDADHSELDELRMLGHSLTVERDGAVGQLEMVRDERDRLDATLAQLRQGEQDRAAELEEARRQVREAHSDVEQFRSASEMAERALSDLDAQLRVSTDELAGVRAELSLAGERAIAGSAVTEQLELLRAEKADVEMAWAAEQQRVAEVEARLAELEATHLDTSTQHRERIVELEAIAAAVDEVQQQLQEAERSAALEEARAERAINDASQMRTLVEQLTHEQSRVVGEIEQLRPIAAEVDRTRATLVDMQRQLEAALGTDDHDGSAGEAINETVRARTRELMELARAIEPFTWGLQQATGFFAEAGVDGATRHIQAMTLLQKTLERLKNELDRLHGAY